MAQMRTVQLTPPCLNAENIKEKMACIRAHRERIFRVEAELARGKLICHNYGHGGAGWTFLFGCVQESINSYYAQCTSHPSFRDKPIAIIGAGCHGLLTAITLARAGHAVRVVAQDSTDLPSHKAAGFFFPRPRKVSNDHERSIFLALGIASYKSYVQIACGTHPFITSGARMVPAYYGTDIDPGFGPYCEQRLIPPPALVRIQFDTGAAYPAIEYRVAHIDAQKIMHELQREAAKLNIPIEHKKIMDFDEIQESVIFNCAGLGAKLLTADPRLIPIQGHLITLQNQPEPLDYLLNMRVVQNNPAGRPRDELIYFAPKDEGILGITFIRGQDLIAANDHEFDRLLARCRNFFNR